MAMPTEPRARQIWYLFTEPGFVGAIEVMELSEDSKKAHVVIMDKDNTERRMEAIVVAVPDEGINWASFTTH